jgi:hypothetical protein
MIDFPDRNRAIDRRVFFSTRTFRTFRAGSGDPNVRSRVD